MMNIHEECLLNYLKKPDELAHTTDVLKVNNHIFEKSITGKLFLANMQYPIYTNHRR